MPPATWPLYGSTTASGPRGNAFGAHFPTTRAPLGERTMLYESPSGTICECCHPSLVAAGGGEFVVMWRNALDGSRDFYTMRLRDGRAASPAEKQGTGTWKLEACPMDGGGVVLHHGQVASAWRREKDIYLAEAGKPERKLGTGQDVALGVNNQGLYAVWSAPGEGLEMWVPGASRATRLSDSGAFPAIVATGDGAILVAWEEGGSISTARM